MKSYFSQETHKKVFKAKELRVNIDRLSFIAQLTQILWRQLRDMGVDVVSENG